MKMGSGGELVQIGAADARPSDFYFHFTRPRTGRLGDVNNPGVLSSIPNGLLA